MPHSASTTPSAGSAHPRESALIIVDLANDFVYAGGTIADAGGPEYQARAATVIPPLQRLLAAAREAGVTIIYSTDAHTPTDSELRKWPPHSMAGTHNAQIVDGLTPQPGDIVLGKTTYSQFQTIACSRSAEFAPCTSRGFIRIAARATPRAMSSSAVTISCG